MCLEGFGFSFIVLEISVLNDLFLLQLETMKIKIMSCYDLDH